MRRTFSFHYVIIVLFLSNIISPKVVESNSLEYFDDVQDPNVISEEEGELGDDYKEKIIMIERRLSEIFANEEPFLENLNRIDSTVNEAFHEVIRDDLKTDFAGGQVLQRDLRAFRSGDGSNNLRQELEDMSRQRVIEKSAASSEGYGFLNEWVVHLEGGENVANRVFQEMGYKSHGMVSYFR